MPRNGFHFVKASLEDLAAIDRLFAEHKPQRVIHPAAQAGVRFSLTNPHEYLDSNIIGYLHILEGCRHNNVEHLVYASSSSVYGANTSLPFSVHQNVDHPLSLYAATKKANELMAHTYAHLYRLPVTGLRFFTVYGPWGRPDMSMFLFQTKSSRRPSACSITYKNFTFVDIVQGVVRATDKVAAPNPAWSGDQPDPATSSAPYRLYNIGNHSPVQLMDYIACIEKAVGKTATINMLPMQPGDVPTTFADIEDLKADIGFEPKTPIEEGVKRFVAWYRDYYRR